MDAEVRSANRKPDAQADQNPTIKTIRAKRIAEEISGTLAARKAGIERTRLSFAECGHLQLSEGELRRLNDAVDQLISAKRKVQQVAKEVGWPAGVCL